MLASGELLQQAVHGGAGLDASLDMGGTIHGRPQGFLGLRTRAIAAYPSAIWLKVHVSGDAFDIETPERGLTAWIAIRPFAHWPWPISPTRC